MTITKRSNSVVIHSYGAEPRRRKIAGDFYTLYVSAQEYSRFSDVEVRRFTRNRVIAFTALEDGNAEFHLKPAPRWRYLHSCAQPFTLEQMRLILYLTDQSKKQLTGKEALDRLLFMFPGSLQDSHTGKNIGLNAGSEWSIQYACKSYGNDLLIEMPGAAYGPLIRSSGFPVSLDRLRNLADVIVINNHELS